MPPEERTILAEALAYGPDIVAVRRGSWKLVARRDGTVTGTALLRLRRLRPLPLVLAEAGRREVPVAVVNGRVGERAFRRMARVPGLCGRLFFSGVAAFGVQTGDHAPNGLVHENSPWGD